MRLFVDNLTNIDFSYLHPDRGLLGETWLASTELQGALDAQGMVCDFGIVKKTLRNWLDSTIDHCLLVPTRSPHLQWQVAGNQISLGWSFGQNRLHCTSPRDAVTLVDVEEITPATVAQWCIEQVQKLLPAELDKLQLEFNPETIDGALYHYSHGLKKHSGNCQRIAHGHRSRIAIRRNGERDPALEQQWAERFRDIYIGTREDIEREKDGHYQFAYTTAQGSFELCLPQQSCYLIDSDTTVEWIANHIAEQIKLDHPSDNIVVKAFEGAGKGAIASR
ncbi:MAG: hypothetical protein GYB33_15135 [Gammaproteobacteria bacterium]|uniref:6-carboxytetrahydropterin synthase n=1 Tax=Pseudomaricurvus alcaniphilus TaxID=1166482 RepID=UPI0014094ED4|nr:6-carboxytetrahydropterin synthase [Pseudomaricurvus alcaniphilus]MBR9911678.1 hypothetical protein [Gammaproteobacteria bacterium]NHN39377.1 hypothetical protein [Pseudomaricurvus alcaniphilus]